MVENAVWAAVMVELGLEGVNVPRRRNMADGLSLESLRMEQKHKIYNFVRQETKVSAYIPKNWKPFPGQKKCTAAPYPSGKGTRIRHCMSGLCMV